MGNSESSQRRIDANRRNAQKSTGPRTEEGKARSRRNSLIHGLAGAGVVVPEDEAQAARERGEQLVSSLRPMNAFELGLVETIAIESVRIDRCRIEERLVRDVRARRAGACWLDERKAEAAKLGKTLAGCPDEVAPKLSTSSAGCDWMLVRWQALGKVLEKTGDWSEPQRSLAMDLMGVSAEVREMDNPLDPSDGDALMSHLRELVESEIDGLLMRREEALDAIDDDLREATSMGLIAVDDPTLVLLRRYETASFRRQRWALDMLHKGRQKPAPIPVMTHDYVERPRQVSSVWCAPDPVPHPESPAPNPDPGAPTPDSDRTHDRGDHASSNGHSLPAGAVPRSERSHDALRMQRAERSQRGGSGQLAGRTHLAGRLLLLARSLAGPGAVARTLMRAVRPRRRLARPSAVVTRTVRPELLRIVALPAA
ncbi:hypothetical protein EP7_003247 [Isosphaeraceae bacterium EP7]